MTKDMARLILGLGPKDGTRDEVMSAFRQRTGMWHPDKHGNDPSKNVVMQAIVHARKVLLGEEAEGEVPTPTVEKEDVSEEEEMEELLRDYLQGKYGKPCRAYTANGEPCSKKAQKGNYGFCHLHRR